MKKPRLIVVLSLVTLLPVLALVSCKRNSICTQEYDPVCGSNKKTYGNACEAKRDGVKEYSAGECPP